MTEHQADVKICPECHTLSRGDFPEGVTQAVQYGERVKSFAVYLAQIYQGTTNKRRIFDGLSFEGYKGLEVGADVVPHGIFATLI